MFVRYHLCKNLFSLTWENAGSYSWVFTVLYIQASVFYLLIKKLLSIDQYTSIF